MSIAIKTNRGKYIEQRATGKEYTIQELVLTSDVNKALTFASKEQALQWFNKLYRHQLKWAEKTLMKNKDDKQGGVCLNVEGLDYEKNNHGVVPYISRYVYYKSVALMVEECFGIKADPDNDYSNPLVGELHYLKMEQIRKFEKFLREKIGISPLDSKSKGIVDGLKDEYEQGYLLSKVALKYFKDYSEKVKQWRVIVPMSVYKKEENAAMKMIVSSPSNQKYESIQIDEKWIQSVVQEGFELYVIKPKNSINIQSGFLKRIQDPYGYNDETVDRVEEATFFTDKSLVQLVADQVGGIVLSFGLTLKSVEPAKPSAVGDKMKALMDRCILETVSVAPRERDNFKNARL